MMRRKKIAIPILAAVVALASVGCKKEQATVTLSATIHESLASSSKVYIDGLTPCWHGGDEVYVNTATYPLSSINGNSAEIVDVVSDENDNYIAIFPASIVQEGANITNGIAIPVTLPRVQVYRLVDGHQRVDVPMGAKATGGALQFRNLCSVVRVNVSNALASDLHIGRIVLSAQNSSLSGSATVSVAGNNSDFSGIAMSVNASHEVALNFPTPATLDAGTGNGSYCIAVPPFSTDNVTITVYTTDGQYFAVEKAVQLAPNTITDVSPCVTSLTMPDYALLVDGITFQETVGVGDASSIVFEYNCSETSEVILSTADSPAPIYGIQNGTQWRIVTSAPIMYANEDCSNMFDAWDWFSGEENEEPGYEEPGEIVLRNIDFGNGFYTNRVTNMSGMFISCGGLTSLDLSGFNTANVTDMSGMFVHCSSLTSLDLSGFNTANVTDMGRMFGNCGGLTSLDLSGFNTANVTNMTSMFDWCTGLTSLDLSSFNTANVTSMSGMFVHCSSLTSLDLSNFNTANVTDMGGMFENCSRLASINVSSFNTARVTNMCAMFLGDSCLTSLDLSEFVTTSVVDFSMMFQDCDNMRYLNLANFDLSTLQNTSLYNQQSNIKYMFDSFASELPAREMCEIVCTQDAWDVFLMEATPDFERYHNLSGLVTRIPYYPDDANATKVQRVDPSI